MSARAVWVFHERKVKPRDAPKKHRRWAPFTSAERGDYSLIRPHKPAGKKSAGWHERSQKEKWTNKKQKKKCFLASWSRPWMDGLTLSFSCWTVFISPVSLWTIELIHVDLLHMISYNVKTGERNWECTIKIIKQCKQNYGEATPTLKGELLPGGVNVITRMHVRSNFNWLIMRLWDFF